MKPEENEVLLEQVRELQKNDDRHDANNTGRILNEKRYLGEPIDADAAKKEMFRRSLRTFLIGGATAAVGFFGWRWMPEEFRSGLAQRAFKFNERVSQFFYRPSRLSPEFPRERVGQRRVNGFAGMETELDATSWKLSVGGLAGRTEDLILTLDDIKALPRVEMITELKCIEGWSNVVHWAGARFSDFAARYLPKTIDGSEPNVFDNPEKLVPYISISTPDNGYFVGWDMQSILHPQTLLAYEMNGAPLLPEHGAPLRIASPTKYGIKQIKRIGRIEFTAERPRDYWAEYGYDWYSGH